MGRRRRNMRGQSGIPMWVWILLALLVVGYAGGYFGDHSNAVHQSTTTISATTAEGNAGAGEGQYQISQSVTAETWTLDQVKMEFVSALDPRKHVSGIHVEFLPVGEVPNDPMRTIVDQAEVNDGYALFTSGKLEVGKTYLLSVNGKDITYDKTKTVRIPIVPPEKTKYTFTEAEKVVPVAHFADINVDTPKVIDLDISGESGVNYKSFTIRIAVSDATPEGAIKNPVLVLKTDEDNPLAPGAIVHIYATRLQGTDFGVPAVDLAGYFANETPIALKGSFVWDEDPTATYMTAADSAIYQIKVGYDADSIQDGQKLIIALDDLGDYKARDFVSNELKAPAEELVIVFHK